MIMTKIITLFKRHHFWFQKMILIKKTFLFITLLFFVICDLTRLILNISLLNMNNKKFEDTKGVIRSCKSKIPKG